MGVAERKITDSLKNSKKERKMRIADRNKEKELFTRK
jgi:hypothetical protein